MGVNQVVIGKLLVECETAVDRVSVGKLDLKAILEELMSIRRQITGKVKDPKEEELIKRLEARVRFIEATMEAHSAAIAEIRTGSGRVTAGMFGGSW